MKILILGDAMGLSGRLAIKKNLVDQLTAPVRWTQSVEKMVALGVNHFIEVGPGKVLSGLIKRIDRNVILNQVNKLEDLKKISND